MNPCFSIFSSSKIVFIESNYDEEMLAQGKYPKAVKERIKGECGHLSNSQSLELAKFLFKKFEKNKKNIK